MPQQNSSALIGLILAAVSWASCPIVLAIVGLVLANKGDKEIKASNGWQTGESLVKAARWLAWLNIIIYGLLFVGYIVFFVVLAATGSFDSPPSRRGG